jgi:hypothetical protein
MIQHIDHLLQREPGPLASRASFEIARINEGFSVTSPHFPY